MGKIKKFSLNNKFEEKDSSSWWKGLESKIHPIFIGAFAFSIIVIILNPILIKLTDNSLLLWVLSLVFDFSKGLVPSLFASAIIYYFVEKGIKVITGVREEENRNYADIYKGFLVSARREVKILDTFINGFIKDIDEEEFFKSLLKKKKVVKILLVMPWSDAAKQRIEDIGPEYKKDKRDMKAEICRNLFKLYDLFESSKGWKEKGIGGSFTIKLFDQIPPMAFYSFGEDIYFSLITPFTPTDKNPNLILSTSSLFGEYADSIFQKLWGDDNKTTLTKNESVNISDALFIQLNLKFSDLESIGIIPNQNKLYFGFDEIDSDYPKYVAVSIGANKLDKYLKGALNNTIPVIFLGKYYEMKILDIFESQAESYLDKLHYIKTTYCFDSIEDSNFYRQKLGDEPTIYQIKITNQ